MIDRLAQAIANLKTEDQDHVFEALRQIADEFGWDLQKRDPGPELFLFTSDLLPRRPHQADERGFCVECDR